MLVDRVEFIRGPRGHDRPEMEDVPNPDAGSSQARFVANVPVGEFHRHPLDPTEGAGLTYENPQVVATLDQCLHEV